MPKVSDRAQDDKAQEDGIMRRKDVTIGMLVHAWTSLWGEYVIKVSAITTGRPARVKGTVLKVLKPAHGDRAKVDMLGRVLEVGICSVKPYVVAGGTDGNPKM